MTREIVPISERRIVGGPTDQMMRIYPLRHPWARDMWKLMLKNTWTINEVDFSRDIKDYKALTPAEKQMYDRALAFLSNLDGIQFNNLTLNIGRYITSPEVSMLIARQAFEEANHVDAYEGQIEAVCDDPQAIYEMFAVDDVLGDKNEFILRQSQILGDDFSEENFALAVVANILLEGVYFHSGFLPFYVLARNGKMLGSADNIRFIQRDESTHRELFMLIWETLKDEMPHVFTESFYAKVRELIEVSVNLEVTWGKYIISGGVLGLTDVIIEGHIKTLADEVAVKLGISSIYNVTNPVPWFKDFSNINGEESNFFESKVKAYSVGGMDW